MRVTEGLERKIYGESLGTLPLELSNVIMERKLELEDSYLAKKTIRNISSNTKIALILIMNTDTNLL